MVLLMRIKPMQTSVSPFIRLIGRNSFTQQQLATKPLTNCNSITLSRWCSRGHSSHQTSRISYRCSSTSTDAVISNEISEDNNKSNDNNCVSLTSNEITTRKTHWASMFQALKAYRAVHGDTLVPATYPDNPQLGNFVDNSRQVYRMRLESEESGKVPDRGYHVMMSNERIEKLNSIGFIWNLFEHSWNTKYEELKLYAAKHGHCLVPWQCKENFQLSLWVSKQRRNYQVRKQEESKGAKPNDYEVVLSDERIRKLEAIGFVFEVLEEQWYERYEELQTYISNHGDTLVPKAYTQNGLLLGRWVDKQRLDYKRYHDRKKLEEKWKDIEISDEEVRKEIERANSLATGMTEERLRLLEEVDFVWNARNYKWNRSYLELCEFVQLNGHAHVREKVLARWASVQRINYKKLQSGDRSPLTEDRMKKLEDIGFLWDAPESRSKSKLKKRK